MPQEKSDATVANAVDLAPGQVLLERYRILEQIGSGSTGVVFRARDTRKGRDIAVKVMFPERLARKEIRDMFLAEARIACELFHPGVVKPSGVYSDGQFCFLTSELLTGRTLRQLMDERKAAGRPFTRQEVIRIIASLIEILHYAHVRTVHRNLKPENIWIDDKLNCRIMDFGVAVLVRSVRPTRKKPPTGNGLYIAPEQWKSWKQVDREADQYALGALTCELLVGKITARKVNSIRRRYKKVNKNIFSVVARMMALNATDRFDSILLAREALENTETGTQSFLASRSLRVLAFVAVLAIAGFTLFQSRDYLVSYWDSVRPLSEAEKQMMFDDMIARANKVNELDRQLRRARLNLESDIRRIQVEIRDADDDLMRSVSEDEKTKLRRQLEQSRVELARRNQLKDFVDPLVFNDDSLQQLDGKIRQTFVLFEQGKHQQAIELIAPIQSDLTRRIQQFGDAEKYLAVRLRLREAQSRWQRFNETSQLQVPADIEQRRRAIEDADRRAENGELAGIPEQFEQWVQAYQEDLERDRLRVQDRESYQAQRAATQALEQALTGYLQRNSLRIDATQADSLQQLRADERAQRLREDFRAAESSSRQIAQLLREYQASAQEAVAEIRRKFVEEQARKARERNQQAIAAAQQAQNADDASQSSNTRQQAPESSADSRPSLADALDEYIPGLQLARIPAGRFSMGSPGRSGERDEKPVREVSVRGFSLMKYEVTFQQYDHYAELTGKAKPDDAGWGRGNRPVINVDWNQASDYADWLSRSTGVTFRLPSEAEWEYAARAGSTTAYAWGDEATHERANYGNEFCCSGLASGADRWVNTAPVGSFAANAFRVNDMHGNVAEWVLDCWNDNYNGAARDARPQFSGHCSQRVVRGGSWSSESSNIRSANRNTARVDRKTSYIGFRLVLER